MQLTKTVFFSLSTTEFAIHYLQSPFEGQFGLRHNFHIRLDLTQTATLGEPQLLQTLRTGLIVPDWGSGKAVLHLFSK